MGIVPTLPKEVVPIAFSRTLERELTAVTEQLDKIEKNIRIELRGHPDSQLWGEAGLIAATMRCVDALDTVTEQRDEAVNNYETAQLLSVRVGEQRDEWKAKYIQQNKDLGHELRDPNGTIWSECKRLQTELATVIAQRDRLAEEITQIKSQLTQTIRAVTISRNGYVQELEQQRDRLAVALERLEKTAGLPAWWDDPASDQARQALQFLTTKP